MFAAASLTEVLPALADTHDPALEFEFSFAGSQTLAAQLVEGAGADLFIAANPETAARVVDAGRAARTEVLMENALVIAVEAPSALGSVEDVAASGVRVAIAAPEVPAGALTASVLRLLEAADAEVGDGLRRNVVTEDPSVRVALSRVELGEADAAFVYATDVAATPGLRALPLPPAFPVTEYVAVLLDGADEEAAAFLDFLLGEDAAVVLTRAGFRVLTPEQRALR